ncbi:MAG: deoxynucleoside kinase [Alphaproteobacteria bacterium]|nr:deoxynucleoside kinase [Alphaproteobacteria bacterium]
MGAGKTSLTQFLCARYGFEPIYEPFSTNPYLDDFYQDMRSWAFHSQIYFLTHKFRLHHGLNDSPRTVVLDRTIYEDAEIFARNLYRGRKMSQRDWQTYCELYESMKKALQPPDLLIYLRCDVRGIRRRIKKRGRESEQQIPAAYIRGLSKLYEEWLESYDLSPVLIWESGRQDYLTHIQDRLEFQRSIEPFL